MKVLLPKTGWLGLTLGALLQVSGLGVTSATAAQPETNSSRLLVVAPDAFHPALEEFIALKEKLRPTELRSLENILRRSSGVDDPEKLKRFLHEEWREHGLGYVLLVGDVDVLPVRFMVLDRVTPAAFDYAFYPSDLYYGDLAKPDGTFDDWNARRESFHAGYFGEVRGEKNKGDPINYDAIDYRPEIAVGRWPVSTPEEVRLVAAKTISYELGMLTNAGPKVRQAGFIAVGGWVDSRGLLDRFAAKLPTGWQVEKRYYADAGHPSNIPAPNHEQVRGLLNEGVDLLVHTGHGQPDAWEQCFSVRDLDRITNHLRLPVVISAGCSTAYFAPLPPYEPYLDGDGKEHVGSDHKEVFTAPPPPPSPYQKGRFNPTGLGEQCLKRNVNGSVVYIGCNTGSQPCALTLVEGFVAALAQAKEPLLGDCWASAIRHYYEKEDLATLRPNADWYPPSIFFQGMKFMLFGDPSLSLPHRPHAQTRGQLVPFAREPQIEVIPLPALRIGGQAARAHTQGLELANEKFLVTARREDVTPKSALLLRSEATRTDWEVWDITPKRPTGAEQELDHPGGMQIDGERLWIPLAESQRHGCSIIRAFKLSDLVAGQPLKAELEFGVPDHIGALAVNPERKWVVGASWDTESVYVWDFQGQLQRRLTSGDLGARGFGVAASHSGSAGVAVQDWKFDGTQLIASGLCRTKAPSQSRLVLLAGFLESDFKMRTVELPKHSGVELAREGMAVQGETIWFLPEDLGATNRVFRLRREAYLE